MINPKQMVSRYYVAIRPQTNDHHNVHREGCPFLPEDEKRIFLGVFRSALDALHEGQRYYFKSHKCKFCLEEHQHEAMEPAFSEINTFVPSEIQISLLQNGGLFYVLN
jgi:hypothetical protein